MKSFKTPYLANKLPMMCFRSRSANRLGFAPPKVLAQAAEGSVSYTTQPRALPHVAVAISPLSTFDANALKDIKHYNHYMF
jgi:hypothetical protein